MPLLIDGHNLIGQTPGISLSDADDEAQLVMLLRRYATAKRNRSVVVVFDHGVYGHPQRLDGYGVACHFARSPRDADQELIRRIRQLARPKDWTLVTSDRQIARIAQDLGVKVLDSRRFAAQLTASAPDAVLEEKPRDVQLSAAEVAEWLVLFGQPAEIEETPAPPVLPAPVAAPKPKPPGKRKHKTRKR